MIVSSGSMLPVDPVHIPTHPVSEVTPTGGFTLEANLTMHWWAAGDKVHPLDSVGTKNLDFLVLGLILPAD